MPELFRSLDAALRRAGLPRHSFGSRWVDAPSIQPERVPSRRVPLHLAERHEDSCSLVCAAGLEGDGNCTTYVGAHRAAGRAA